MHARPWYIGHVYERELPARAALHINPAVAVPWLRQSIAGPVVVHVLVFASHQAVIAILATAHINNQTPLFH
jgi:hypothetical protein